MWHHLVLGVDNIFVNYCIKPKLDRLHFSVSLQLRGVVAAISIAKSKHEDTALVVTVTCYNVVIITGVVCCDIFDKLI